MADVGFGWVITIILLSIWLGASWGYSLGEHYKEKEIVQGITNSINQDGFYQLCQSHSCINIAKYQDCRMQYLNDCRELFGKNITLHLDWGSLK